MYNTCYKLPSTEPLNMGVGVNTSLFGLIIVLVKLSIRIDSCCFFSLWFLLIIFILGDDKIS